MKVLGRIFLNSRKDVNTERRKDGDFLWDVEELTFLIKFQRICIPFRDFTFKVINREIKFPKLY